MFNALREFMGLVVGKQLSDKPTIEGTQVVEEAVARTQIDHVEEVHHLHIWALSTTDNALTAHVVIDRLEHMETVKSQLKQELCEHGIAHSTLEFETPDSHCHEHCC